MKIISICYCQKKCFHSKLINCQPQITYIMASQVTYCIQGTLIKTYHLVISFTLSQYKKLVNGVIERLKISLIDGDGNEISSKFKMSIVLHVV